MGESPETVSPYRVRPRVNGAVPKSHDSVSGTLMRSPKLSHADIDSYVQTSRAWLRSEAARVHHLLSASSDALSGETVDLLLHRLSALTQAVKGMR